MTTIPIDEPVPLPRELRCGTDMVWPLRRTIDGVPAIPTSAHAQLRSEVGGELWLDWSSANLTSVPHIVIEPITGWLYITTPWESTNGAEWLERFGGVWDLKVEYGGSRLPWVSESNVNITHDVTRDV